MTDKWHRELRSCPGREAALFAGLARVFTDVLSTERVLLIADGGHAAALLIRNDQEAVVADALEATELAVLPGTLQMLQAVTQPALSKIITATRALYEEGTAVAAATAAATCHQKGPSEMRGSSTGSSYLKLLLIGVRNAARGRGLGTALLRAATDAADAANQPLLLELLEPSLQPLYSRHGFAVAGRCSDFTLMLRQPRV